MDRRQDSPDAASGKTQAITIVGRVGTPAGRIDDLVFQGQTELTAKSDIPREQFAGRTTEIAQILSRQWGDALAFVGIGFGPAPRSDFEKRIWKGQFNEADHPRVPEGCPEGGEFCSAGETSDAVATDSTADELVNQNAVAKDIMSKVAKRAARKVLRNELIAGLRVVAGVAADILPFIGEIFDGYEIGQTVADGIALDEEVTAAEIYVRNGPKALEDLRVDPAQRAFRSYDAFTKIEIEKYYGPAEDGYEYHHIVEQGSKGARFSVESLQNTDNIIKIPRLLHEEISAEYSKLYKDTNMTLRQWLRTQPYDVQREKGLETLRKFAIIK